MLGSLGTSIMIHLKMGGKTRSYSRMRTMRHFACENVT
jgi:hypothetical protein